MEALFSSMVGGDALRRRILEVVAEAATLGASHHVDIHIMTFAFTDSEIASTLAEVAATLSSVTIRILADWSQRTKSRGQQVERLAVLALPNLHVRYSHDQPYVWNDSTARMRWSYHASLGLLHHKTLVILVDGQPWRLLCGSFNWTGRAVRSYENLLIVSAEQPGSRQLIRRVEMEFEALWSDGRITISASEAYNHYSAILQAFRANPTIDPKDVIGLAQGHGDDLRALAPDDGAPLGDSLSLALLPSSASDISFAIAFSSRAMEPQRGWAGHATANRMQGLLLRTQSGRIRRVPLTITSLALDTIARAASGETLKVAMYGLSPRVPEYGALLDAARRGVSLLLLLDRNTGSEMSERLRKTQQLESLSLEVRTAGRTMHQKYIVNTVTGTVLTGTANMSTDAATRHFEHRIRVSRSETLARMYSADFDEIWRRSRWQAADPPPSAQGSC